MTSGAFDFSPLLAPGLPPAAVKFAGFPKYNFIGGHNDPMSRSRMPEATRICVLTRSIP